MDESLEAELRELHDRVCKAIADPKRLLILNVLRDVELSVGDIAAELGVTHSNASQHLAVLRDRGIVTSRRAGTTVYYSLSNPKILTAIDLMREFVAEAAPHDVEAPGRRVTSIFLG